MITITLDVKVRIYCINPHTRELYYSGTDCLAGTTLCLGEPKLVLEKRKRVQVEPIILKGKETGRFVKTAERDSIHSQEEQRKYIPFGRLRTAS